MTTSVDPAVGRPPARTPDPAPDARLRRMTRTLQVLLSVAFLISIVHYVDNTVRWDSYAQDGGGPAARWMVPVAWVAFTAAGIAGYVAFRRRRWGLAAGLIGAYSVSGTIGVAHYTTVAPSDFSAFQNAFVALDTLAGVALLVVAVRLALDPPDG